MAHAHLRRWHPARPQRLAVDARPAKPTEAVAPDPDAISEGRLVFEDHIEKMIVGIDHHRALGLLALIGHELTAPFRIDLLPIGEAIDDAVVLGRAGEIGERPAQHDCGVGIVNRAGGGARQPKNEPPAGHWHRSSPPKAT